MADIRKFSVAKTARLHLRDANDALMFTDDKTPIAVVVYGPGSKEFAAAQARQQNAMVDKLKNKGKTQQSAEQKASESAEFLTACTQSWEGMEYDALTGDDLSMAVYADRSIGFIADQVSKFMSDWANFKPGSTTP
jgi:hypothetical protein